MFRREREWSAFGGAVDGAQSGRLTTEAFLGGLGQRYNGFGMGRGSE
jgi:hypothetical protein